MYNICLCTCSPVSSSYIERHQCPSLHEYTIYIHVYTYGTSAKSEKVKVFYATHSIHSPDPNEKVPFAVLNLRNEDRPPGRKLC